MIDTISLLDEIKKAPYKELTVSTPHSGEIEFVVNKAGVKVNGKSGNWGEKPGTLLAYLTREGNKKPIYSPEKGEVVMFHDVQNNQFVQAGTPLLKIRHFLTKQEVIDIILKQTLHLFLAPEKGKYYFVSAIDLKLKAKGLGHVNIKPGDEVLIISRMKRETVLTYEGQPGIIFTIYFNSSESVEAGSPLLGICPRDQLEDIKEVVARIQNSWEEKE
ncbi:biotin attachment protein [Desulfonatronovibrio magnus]|uniref:biotin attachment protein n=1 Tax=Desulfonatronovibrio magnus TaxID=698827 RepID=UPI0005EBAC44|nr:biotin attachment protein [Desulfonatronovibrio magnus]